MVDKQSLGLCGCITNNILMPAVNSGTSMSLRDEDEGEGGSVRSGSVCWALAIVW